MDDDDGWLYRQRDTNLIFTCNDQILLQDELTKFMVVLVMSISSS